MSGPVVAEIDPFDLPGWLEESEVTWRAGSSVQGSHHVTGALSAAEEVLPCDLLAADVAYPRHVLDPAWRRAAHQQWTLGQVLLVEYDARLTLAVPGVDFTADRVLESITRLAKAVGVSPSRFVVALRL